MSLVTLGGHWVGSYLQFGNAGLIRISRNAEGRNGAYIQ